MCGIEFITGGSGDFKLGVVALVDLNNCLPPGRLLELMPDEVIMISFDSISCLIGTGCWCNLFSKFEIVSSAS